MEKNKTPRCEECGLRLSPATIKEGKTVCKACQKRKAERYEKYKKI